MLRFLFFLFIPQLIWGQTLSIQGKRTDSLSFLDRVPKGHAIDSVKWTPDPSFMTKHLILVLDYSGSMEDQISNLENRVKEFVALLPSDTKIKLIKYDSKVYEYGSWISPCQFDSLIHVHGIRHFKTGTSTWMALSFAVNAVLDLALPTHVILFTDGDDNASPNYWTWLRDPRQVSTPEGLIQKIESASVPIQISSVVMDSPDTDSQWNREGIQLLTNKTGGQYIETRRESTHLQLAFQTVASNTGTWNIWSHPIPSKPSKQVVIAPTPDPIGLDRQFIIAWFPNDEVIPSHVDSLMVNRIQTLLERVPNSVLKIWGHASSPGKEKRNLWLSEARALYIKGHLIKMGVPQHRIQSIANGSRSRPVMNDDSESTQQLNRIAFGIIQIDK